jgi:hypothetical protein
VRCNVDLQDILSRTALQHAEHAGFTDTASLIRNKKETPLLGKRVVINGLVAKPELNGRTGTALSFDDDKGRYFVELDQSSTSLMIKPCNLLPEVCSVALCSLFSAAASQKGSGAQREIEDREAGSAGESFVATETHPVAALQQQEDADVATRELLVEEEKDKADAAAAASQNRTKQAAGKVKERARLVIDGQGRSQKPEHTEVQKDTDRTEAKTASASKSKYVAGGGGESALKAKVEEGGEEEEERKQAAAERKEAGAASQGIQGRRLSQEKDAEDHLPAESSAKRRSSKVNKKKGGDQGASACKTAPWATEAKEAGVVAAGVGAKSWPAPLQSDVQQAARIMSAADAEALFMSKFGNLSDGGGGGETDMRAEDGSACGESDDVFKSMDAECTVCMQESKVRQHQVAYSVDDLYFD